jgi:Rrf2 family protein
MFRISRKTEYALRGMIYLARKGSSEYVMLKEIGAATRASHVFLAKIFQTLGDAGLVQSSRGAVGGFRLSRGAEEITLKNILEATEGPVQANVCVVDSDACDFSKTCSAHLAWVRVRNIIDAALSEITLKEIAAERT